MREIGFKRYLEGVCLKQSEIGYLLSCCRKIEQDYHLSLDNIITSELATRKLIQQITANPGYSSRQKVNLPNGLKRYYQWANGQLTLLRINDGPKWQPKVKWSI